MDGWGSPWKVDLGLGDVLAQASAFKDSIEKTMEDALASDEADPNRNPRNDSQPEASSPSVVYNDSTPAPASAPTNTVHTILTPTHTGQTSNKSHSSSSGVANVKIGGLSKSKSKSKSRSKHMKKNHSNRRNSSSESSNSLTLKTPKSEAENHTQQDHNSATTNITDENENQDSIEMDKGKPLVDENELTVPRTTSNKATEFLNSASSITAEFFGDFGAGNSQSNKQSETHSPSDSEQERIDMTGIAQALGNTTNELVSGLFGGTAAAAGKQFDAQNGGEPKSPVGNLLARAQGIFGAATPVSGWDEDEDNDDLFRDEIESDEDVVTDMAGKKEATEMVTSTKADSEYRSKIEEPAKGGVTSTHMNVKNNETEEHSLSAQNADASIASATDNKIDMVENHEANEGTTDGNVGAAPSPDTQSLEKSNEIDANSMDNDDPFEDTENAKIENLHQLSEPDRSDSTGEVSSSLNCHEGFAHSSVKDADIETNAQEQWRATEHGQKNDAEKPNMKDLNDAVTMSKLEDNDDQVKPDEENIQKEQSINEVADIRGHEHVNFCKQDCSEDEVKSDEVNDQSEREATVDLEDACFNKSNDDKVNSEEGELTRNSRMVEPEVDGGKNKDDEANDRTERLVNESVLESEGGDGKYEADEPKSQTEQPINADVVESEEEVGTSHSYENSECSPGVTDQSQVESDNTKHDAQIGEMIKAHTEEKQRFQQLITERERQLESQVLRATQINQELENTKDENMRLRNQLELTQEAATSAEQLRRQMQKLAMENKELKSRAEEAELRSDSLMEEGLALAKKQGDLEASLRKIRKEKRDLESKTEKLSSELEIHISSKYKLEAELKEAREHKARGDKSMAEISESTVETNKKLNDLDAKLKIALAHEAEMKSALDSAWRDLADQKKENSTVTHELNSTRSEVQQLRHQLQEQINSAQMRNDRTSTMERSVADVRRAMMQQQREWEMNEANLRDEISLLKQRLQDQVRRNEDLVESAAVATAPLVRQIEGLQSVAASRQEAFETAQNALLTRAIAAENAEAAAGEAKRKAEQARGELVLRVTELEAQLAGVLSEKARNESQVRLAKERAHQAEKERLSVSTQLEEVRGSLDAKSKEMRAIESRLRKALLIEQERHETELQEKETYFEKLLQEKENTISELELKVNSQQQLAPESKLPERSMLSQGEERGRRLSSQHDSQESILSKLKLNESNGVTNNIDVVGRQHTFDEDIQESVTPNGMASVIQIQRLQARLKQRAGEIEAVKVQKSSVERSRDALAEEVIRLTDQTNKLKKELENTPKLKRQVDELTLKHEVLLELLGEKEERVDELEADLEEVKQVYRAQIDSLAAQIEIKTTTEK